MRKILILGAGRSASSLIHYLIAHAREQDWRITVADKEESSAARMVAGGTEVATGIGLDASDTQARGTAIGEHDLIISMLPAFMHMDVLKDCLRLKKHVITPSYVPDALWAMDATIKDKRGDQDIGHSIYCIVDDGECGLTPLSAQGDHRWQQLFLILFVCQPSQRDRPNRLFRYNHWRFATLPARKFVSGCFHSSIPQTMVDSFMIQSDARSNNN